MTKAETAVVAEVKAALERIPCVRAIWRNQSGSVRVKRGYLHLAPKGTPDLIGYLDCGTILAVEVKRPGESTTEEQDAFISKAQQNGACAFVAFGAGSAIEQLYAWRKAKAA